MKIKNRWVILAAAVIANLCIGSAYAWSVFQNPLINEFNLTLPQTNLAFTISLFVVPFAMILAGKIKTKLGSRRTIIIGGLIFGTGIFLAGFTNSVAGLYLTYGVLGGTGIGFVNGSTVPNAVQWFPDKRGLSGGIVAGGFACGPVLFAPLAVNLIESLGVLHTFRLLGVVYAVVVTAAALVISSPQENYKPKGWSPPTTSTGSVSTISLTTVEMLKTFRFWVLWVIYVLGCIAGLTIIGHASPIGQERIGLSPETAAGVIVLIAIANGGGRMLWGAISDRIGRYRSVILMYILAGGMLILLNWATSYLAFVVAVMGIALSFGGFVGVFPSILADRFGPLHLAMNYGAMFSGYGLAAFIGPRLAAEVRQSTGDYSLAFIIASVMSAAGILLTIFVSISARKKSA